MGLLADDRGVADDAVRPNDRTGLDDDVAPENDGCLETGFGVNRAVLADPNSRRGLRAGNLEARASGQRVVVRLLVLLQVADVGPVVLRDEALDDLAFVHQTRKEIA